ncbi:DNA methyltransferase [Streptomyces sp. NPDC056105]|uniref:DNA methyltransferase n=1 Tax=Streptomyces sp. NPDC056105 TaxID=3345714 RepID=UPI0035DE1331
MPTTVRLIPGAEVAGWTWRGIAPWRRLVSRRGRTGSSSPASTSPGARRDRPTPTGTLSTYPVLFTASQPRKDRVQVTQKPVEVTRRAGQDLPAGRHRAEPLSGSGTTGVAALREGRKFIGVELSVRYADRAERRLLQTTQQARNREDFGLAGPGDA